MTHFRSAITRLGQKLSNLFQETAFSGFYAFQLHSRCINAATMPRLDLLDRGYWTGSPGHELRTYQHARKYYSQPHLIGLIDLPGAYASAHHAYYSLRNEAYGNCFPTGVSKLDCPSLTQSGSQSLKSRLCASPTAEKCVVDSCYSFSDARIPKVLGWLSRISVQSRM